MIKNKIIYPLSLATMLLLFSCQGRYENVTGSAVYSGDPYVMLSSTSASIYIDVNTSNNSELAGVFVDSLILSHPLSYDLVVTLATYDKNTLGTLGTNFTFQREVTIAAGERYGSYQVEALDITADQVNDYQLAIMIESTDSDSVIAGLNGIKYENEDRQKRNKIYNFR